MRRRSYRIHQNFNLEEVIVFSPTGCRSSEKNAKEKNEDGSPAFSAFSLDDIILPVLIGILIYERYDLKKSGASKEELTDYDHMIASLIYIYI